VFVEKGIRVFARSLDWGPPKTEKETHRKKSTTLTGSKNSRRPIGNCPERGTLCQKKNQKGLGFRRKKQSGLERRRRAACSMEGKGLTTLENLKRRWAQYIQQKGGGLWEKES